MPLLSSGARPAFRLCRCALIVSSLFQTSHAGADTALDGIVVSATRIETAADSLPATVTSIERAALDRRQPRDTADLFRDEPDVAMARDLRRFGATRVNIRGIEDNRVIQTVDGVRLPDYYNGGGPTNYTLSSAPGSTPDFLQRVEIVRGAASSLYGSDAIGGVVGYVTLKPADLLKNGAPRALRLKGAYDSASHAFSKTALAALRMDSTELLLGVSHTAAGETANQGEQGGMSPARSQPNPRAARDRGLLASLVTRPAAGHTLSATLEGREQHADTDIRRIAASMPKVSMMQGDDNARRLRASLEWQHKPVNGLYDRLTARLFQQHSETLNRNDTQRSNTSASCSAVSGSGNNCHIEQEFSFDQQARGASLMLEKGMGAHLLSAGLDLGRVSVEERRDARIRNETRATTLTSLAGESYPLRDFANGVTETLGLFVQDDIGGLADERLGLTLGLRLDHTRLRPEVDALARQVLDALGRQVVSQSHGSVSPKLGAQWKLGPALSAYGQVASGFRAPNYAEVNGAFRNSSQFYSTVPNPGLKPEKSVALELGLRLQSGALRAQAAVFDNRYRDFIETVQLACPADPRCYAPNPAWRTNMALNLARVRIYGAELRANWDLAPGWRADGALAYSHGSDERSGLPLNSIEPARLSAGLVRDAGGWGAEARLRAATRKGRIDDSAGAFFRTPGYAVADLAAWRTLGRGVRLNLALHNLFDRKYWLWSDIRQADAPAPAGVDFYSQPGRQLSLALQADF